MSKYGAIIAEARKPENHLSESQKTAKPENQKTIKTANKISVKPQSQKAGKESAVQPDEKQEEVNLSVKVALNRRRHWASQAKLKGETLTEAITSALSERYGEPQG